MSPKILSDHLQPKTASDLDGYLNLLRGYFLMSQAAIKVMQKRGGGAIINIGSMWAFNAVATTFSHVKLMFSK